MDRRQADARRGEDPEVTWQDLQAARRDLLGRLAGLDDAALVQPAATPIGYLRTVYFWFSDCAQHDVAHAEALVPVLDAGSTDRLDRQLVLQMLLSLPGTISPQITFLYT
jgi:hypothetical protein